MEFTFAGLHGVISQRIEILITTAENIESHIKYTFIQAQF
jgi:hypothetical protein